MKSITNAPIRPVPTAALLPFTLVTFAISWGLLGLYIFFPERAVAWWGDITGKHPAFVLAVWAPAFAAFAVTLYFAGVQGVRTFLSRLGLWRCPAGWVLFLLLGIPLVFAAGAVLKGSLFPFTWSFDSVGAALGAMLFNESRGSILWPALFHFQVNNPLWPDAQPYDTYFFVGVAVLVVWVNRHAMLTRDGAVTEVFVPRSRAPSSR